MLSAPSQPRLLSTVTFHGTDFAFFRTATIYFCLMFAAIQKTSPWYQHFAFNWFDVALVVVLAFGFWRGRKRGMTKEFLPTLQWLAILLGAGFGHVYLADWFQQQGIIRQVFGKHFNERTAALMSAYLTITLVIFMVFTALKRKYNPKLEGSNFFGGNEYYWGVVAGLVRYVCILLVALALLNAPFYSTADIASAKAYNNRWYGGGLKDYSGDFIPSVNEVQDAVFKQSLIGPLIKERLALLLINTTEMVKKTGH
jgi:uncharacterized membrane protein required for colicin V production